MGRRLGNDFRRGRRSLVPGWCRRVRPLSPPGADRSWARPGPSSRGRNASCACSRSGAARAEAAAAPRRMGGLRGRGQAAEQGRRGAAGGAPPPHQRAPSLCLPTGTRSAAVTEGSGSGPGGGAGGRLVGASGHGRPGCASSGGRSAPLSGPAGRPGAGRGVPEQSRPLLRLSDLSVAPALPLPLPRGRSEYSFHSEPSSL